MEPNPLPAEARGKWIWRPDLKNQVETHILFRREFTLDAIPSSAELWIAARSFYHLFVNGHHLGYALGTAPRRASYVRSYDVAYLLATGTNVLAVMAHNTEVARSSCFAQPGGLWCQLDVNDKPLVWSDRSFKTLIPAAYAGNRPRRSVSEAFTERVDLGEFPAGWRDPGFGDAHWIAPELCPEPDGDGWILLPCPGPELTVQPRRFEQTALRGTWRRSRAATNVSFENLAARRGPGAYVAETHLFSPEETDLGFELYADNPYRLFLNGQAIKEQGLRPLTAGDPYPPRPDGGFRQGEMVGPDGVMHLVEGWNRLTFFLDVQPGTSGMTMIFPQRAADAVHLQRVPDRTALPGWSVSGPLRTPMVNILGNLTLAGDDSKEFHIPVGDRPVAEGPELMACDFTPDAAFQPAAFPFEEGVELRQGQYVILEIEETVFGCPRLRLEGSRGDLVDVITGTEVAGGQLPPWREGRDHTDTLILGAAPTEWMSGFPKAVSAVMVVARQAQSVVRLSEAMVKTRRYSFPNPGRFECADPALNAIWRNSRRTLDATVQETFMDAPGKEQTQYIADALIESWASYHVYGDFSLAARSLVEFASAQFETGEMPAACPSGLYWNIADYALLWPVWLRQHYLYTGDRKLLDRLLPNAENLFSYFAEITDPETGALRDLGRRFKAYCFLDHGPIDRHGVVTGLNALYVRALLSGVWLFDTVGREEIAELLRQRATRVVASLRTLAWNPELGLFADGWDGERAARHSPQTNVLALYGGLADPAEYDRIFSALFTAEPPFEREAPGPANNPYFKYFVLETAFALGRRGWAFDYMRWYWNSMVERGARTWWELFDPEAAPGQHSTGSGCHGYGASPSAFLIREVAGIRPAIPGFTAVYFNPLYQRVRSAQAKIPTRYGHISVEWEMQDDGHLEAAIDATYPLAVIPELQSDVAATATLRVSEEVSIFAAEG